MTRRGTQHTNDPGGNHPRVFATTLAAIALVTVGLHIGGALALRDSFWGVHFYAFFHPFLLWLSTALVLAVSIVLVLRPERAGAWLSEILGQIPRGALAAGTTAAGAGALLWLARARHTYLGDGNVLVTSVPAGQAFHPHQPLTMLAQQVMYRLTAGFFGAGERSRDLVASDAVALGSVILGVVFAVVVWRIARELSGPRRAVALLAAAVLLAQGYAQLFFGYVENYTFYAVGVALYLWLSLRYLRGAGPLLLPAAALLLVIALHLSAAILIPSFLVLAVHAFLTPARRLRAARDLAIAAAVLVGVDVALAAWQPGYHFMAELLRVAGIALTRREEGAPGYMLSSIHLRDFWNEQFLIGPLGIFLFVPAVVTAFVRRSGHRARHLFLVVAGAAYVGASWLAGDSNLGYARNWDLLAPGALVYTAAGLGLFLSPAKGDARRAAAVLSCALAVSLYHTVPWIATNALLQRSFERLKTLPLGLGRTEVLVGKWYSWRGSLDEAEEWFEKAIQVNPRNNNAHYLLGLVHWDKGEMSEAADAIARAVRLRPDKLLFRERLVTALRAAGRNEDTLPHVEFVLERKPEDVNYWIYYAETLYDMGREDEAVAAYRKALPLFQRIWDGEPESFRTNYTFGILYGNLGEHEKALSYFERALAADPQSGDAHYYAGLTLYFLDRHREANAHFRRCLEINPDHPHREDMEQWIEEE
ncbi:MAG: tetratricopeptide repeat protein [Candidatus Krumholzibacteriia bacterium]